MNRREAAIIGAAVRFIRRRAAVFGKRGQTKFQAQYARWADAISKLLSMAPKGCRGCAYEHAKCGRCVDCSRVENRTDNFRRKFV